MKRTKHNIPILYPTIEIEKMILEEYEIATCMRGADKWCIGEYKPVATYHGEKSYGDMLASLQDNSYITVRTVKDNNRK